jgi:hypothetical protein
MDMITLIVTKGVLWQHEKKQQASKSEAIFYSIYCQKSN